MIETSKKSEARSNRLKLWHFQIPSTSLASDAQEHGIRCWKVSYFIACPNLQKKLLIGRNSELPGVYKLFEQLMHPVIYFMLSQHGST